MNFVRATWVRATSLATAWICLGVMSWASNPEIVSISPPGVVRGQSTEVTFGGARLADVKQILFFTPGIEVTKVTSIDESKFSATIQVPNDSLCDLHPFRVVTASGLSNLRYLGVGSFPIVDEKEPNSEFATPQEIALNVTVHGTVKQEDVDYFAISMKKGETLTVEIEGLRLAYMSNFFDPFVAILDNKRFEVARSDDLPLVQQDGICSFTAPEDGRYIIEVRESSFGGSDSSVYRLHVGAFPRPLTIYPSGGSPGEELKVTCVDQAGTTWTESIKIPKDADSVFRFAASRNGMTSPSPNYLRVTRAANLLEGAENDDPNKVAIADSLPVAFNGILEKEGDQDWFGIAALKGQQLEIRAYARGTIRSPVDAVLTIQKVGGGQLAVNDDSGGPDASISFKVPEDGKYAIGIRDHLHEGSPHHVYRIEVLPQEPSAATTVNEQERYVSQVINVPAGARMAVEANLIRRFTSGEGEISIPDLPEGMRHSKTSIEKDLTMVPLMLHAAADAKPQGKLVELLGKVQVSPEIVITGKLEQRTQIIRGRNNADVWGHTGSKLAVAITEPAPFDVVVVQPKVALVRNGSMDLVVNVQRKEGFDKPIGVRLLSLPSGVGASGSVSIPGDKSQGVIPLTASSGAQLRTWPITVLATYDSGRGPITIASEFVQLEVADSLFEFQFNKTVAEQGKSATILVGVKPKRSFEGKAEIEILGLPPGTTSPQSKLPFVEGTEKLEFALEVPATTRQGNYKTVVCRAVVINELGTITQTNGNAEVQVDVPLPPPKTTPAPTPANTATQTPPVQAPAKPLTRLEQLRKMKEESSGKP